MRALLITTAAILVISAANAANAASAADVGPPIMAEVPPPLPVPAFNWTGFYVGANVGYGWSHRDFSNTLTGTLGTIQLSGSNSGTDDGRGVLGGAQVGYNHQFVDNWVAGIEADIDGADIGSSTSACFPGFGTAVCGDRDTDVNAFGTVRGRLGYALNNVLLYGTGGFAWGHGTNTIQFTCLGPACPGTSALAPTSPAPTSVDVNPIGWAAGAGVEWAFLPNLTLQAQYLHLQFDGVTEDRSKSSSFIPSLFVTSYVSSNIGINLVRIGVNYLF